MIKIKLIPKTKKGKERVKRWGDTWRVVENKSIRMRIVAESDKGLLDPFVFVPESTRWIEKQQDQDFDWELFNEIC